MRVSPKAGGGDVVGVGKTGEAVGKDGVLAGVPAGSDVAVGAEVLMGLGVVVGMNVAVGGGEEQAIRSNVKGIKILVKGIKILVKGIKILKRTKNPACAVHDVFISAFLLNSFWPVLVTKTSHKIKSSAQAQG
jgi:hypothetical protein